MSDMDYAPDGRTNTQVASAAAPRWTQADEDAMNVRDELLLLMANNRAGAKRVRDSTMVETTTKETAR